jgi:hypothetical protein
VAHVTVLLKAGLTDAALTVEPLRVAIAMLGVDEVVPPLFPAIAVGTAIARLAKTSKKAE